MNLDEAMTYLDQGHFSSGSMGPKVAAAVDYVLATGKQAIISNLENLANAVKGISGTIIHQ
jgi:carbamate kinase